MCRGGKQKLGSGHAASARVGMRNSSSICKSADCVSCTRHQEELGAGEEIAHCPSCSLTIRVIYDPVRLIPLPNALLGWRC